MERLCLMQEHMTAQDSNFEAFSYYVTWSLMSMFNEMDANNATMIARINHMISSQNENHYHYAQLYREICDFLDHNFGNDRQGWHHGVRPISRGRGGR